MTFLHGASRSVLWCGTFCSLQMASALRMRFSIPCSLRSPADAAAPRAPLPSSRPPSTLTRRRPPGPGSGVGAPCRGHRGALWLRRRAPGRVGAASTKPGAGTSPAFLCLLNLVLISEKTSYYTVRKTLKDRKSAPSPRPSLPPRNPPLPALFYLRDFVRPRCSARRRAAGVRGCAPYTLFFGLGSSPGRFPRRA